MIPSSPGRCCRGCSERNPTWRSPPSPGAQSRRSSSSTRPPSTSSFSTWRCAESAGLPRRLGIPILLTQHLPSPFMPVLARQLAAESGGDALVAEEGTLLLPDRILLAPGDAHLTLCSELGQLKVRLEPGRAESGCLPS